MVIRQHRNIPAGNDFEEHVETFYNKTGSSTEVPTGISEFNIDLLPPKEFANKFFNIIHWNKMPKGGHFAALEQPELMAGELRAFAQQVNAMQ